MEIRRAPSGRNVYWLEPLGNHQILHLGCFRESLERSLDMYAELLSGLSITGERMSMEIQSRKRWWFDERRRDRHLSWKPPMYEDEAYLAYELRGKDEIVTALRQFWLLKEVRFYYWTVAERALQPQDLLPALARKGFSHLGQFIPSVVHFVAEREMCRSYLRVMFHRCEARFIGELVSTSAESVGMELSLEAEIFKPSA